MNSEAQQVHASAREKLKVLFFGNTLEEPAQDVNKVTNGMLTGVEVLLTLSDSLKGYTLDYILKRQASRLAVLAPFGILQSQPSQTHSE